MITVVLFRDGKPMRYFPIAAKGATHVALRVVEDLLGDTVLELLHRGPELVAAGRWSSTSVWSKSDEAHEAGRRRQRHGRSARDRGDPGCAAAPRRSTSPCLATSRTATTTGSCCPTCWRAATTPSEIYLNGLDWYNDNDIDLRAGVRVVRIDRFARLVHADDGSVTRYDYLILATGSRSFFPPMAGLWADDKTLTDGVFGFRTLDDCVGMINQAAQRTKAVVIGGGLLGLEAARGLQSRGLTVDVVHAGPTLMNAQLDDTAGAILRKSVQNIGITVHVDKRTTEVRTDADGRLSGIVFSDGDSIDCDMLVIATGIRPNVGLAQRAGLTVERATVVDDQMRSIDDDNIYVVGECAQHRGQVYGLVAPLWEQATVLADHVTGTDTTAAYHGSRTATKLKVAGVDVASMGLKAPELEDDEFVQYSEPRHGVYKTIVIRDGKLVGRHAARRRQQGVVPDAGVRQRATAARRAGVVDVRHRHPRCRGRRI